MSYTPENHSAGPWTLQQLETEHHGYENWPTYAVRSRKNVCLAIVGDVDRYESERIPANARLIAASPMLYALVRAHALAYPNDEYADRIATVISEIEGETP